MKLNLYFENSMTLSSKHVLTHLSLVFALFAFSGCSHINLLEHFNSPPPQEVAEVCEPSEEKKDPNLDLIPAETEINLNEELDALRKVGTWDNSEPVVVGPPVVQYDFPVTINKQVQMYLNLFQNGQRKHFGRWLARSSKYLPFIQQELKKAGLPQDLAYLAMIESGFNQRAYSRARAVGLWQFMRGTGKQYHLTIDRYVDERRNAEKSTQAAIEYLADLHNQFDDWYLAVAAYNAGPGKIRYGLKRYKAQDFWQLAKHRYLKLETKRYVPKLIASIIIAKEPEKYGFTNINYQTPTSYDTLKVGPGMSLEAVALVSKTSSKQIKSLNLELRTGKTPPNRSSYQVKIPAGSKTIAQKNMSRLHSVVSTGFKTHKVKKGETLSRICRRYGVNKTTLLKVNNLHSSSLATGRRLRIPYRTIDYQLLPEGSPSFIAAAKEGLILHQIKPGETISKIARKYNVPADMLVAWNGLTSVHNIRAGNKLALYIVNKKSVAAKTRATSNSPVSSPSTATSSTLDNIIVFADGKKSRPTDVTAAADTVSWYKVKNGDSLWTISRKFNTSPNKIKRWNNLKSNLIHPGSRLKLKDV